MLRIFFITCLVGIGWSVLAFSAVTILAILGPFAPVVIVVAAIWFHGYSKQVERSGQRNAKEVWSDLRLPATDRD